EKPGVRRAVGQSACNRRFVSDCVVSFSAEDRLAAGLAPGRRNRAGAGEVIAAAGDRGVDVLSPVVVAAAARVGLRRDLTAAVAGVGGRAGGGAAPAEDRTLHVARGVERAAGGRGVLAVGSVVLAAADRVGERREVGGAIRPPDGDTGAARLVLAAAKDRAGDVGGGIAGTTADR